MLDHSPTIGTTSQTTPLWRQSPLWRSAVVRCVALGIVLAGVQTLLAIALTAFVSNEPYLGLVRWDGWLYAHIAEHGYRSTLPPVRANMDLANVAFFPGYPVTAGIISRWTGLSVRASLLLTAQAAAAVFWVYFLLILERWKVGWRLRAGAVAAVMVHPAAFFLVAAYSESMFLAALLGFVFWSARSFGLNSQSGSPRPSTWIVAALHGFIMTATRVAGLPLVMYPVFDAFVFGASALRTQNATSRLSHRFRAVAKVFVPCFVGATGGLAFFAFCQFSLGQWNLYFETQRIGWNVAPDYAALFKLKNYFCFASLSYDWVRWPDDLSRLSVLSTLAVLLFCGLTELRLAKAGNAMAGRRERIMLYLMAAAIFYIHTAGVSSRHMTSMIRYAFGCHTLLVLAIVNLMSDRQSPWRNQPSRRLALWLLAAASLIIQVVLVLKFAANEWVA